MLLLAVVVTIVVASVAFWVWMSEASLLNSILIFFGCWIWILHATKLDHGSLPAVVAVYQTIV